MQPHPACPPVECADWIAQQQGEPAGHAETCRRHVAESLRSLACTRRAQVRGRAAPRGEGELEGYAMRLWTCFEYHWRRQARKALHFATVKPGDRANCKASELGVCRP
ncbi:MAG TPA: hypothetical protein VMV69_09555 [Pirellulales bacterium]|nr:hypothetical protein [Pirellulales bacterium]